MATTPDTTLRLGREELDELLRATVDDLRAPRPPLAAGFWIRMLLPARPCVDCGEPTPALTSHCGACAERHDLGPTRAERRAGA